MSKAAAVLAEGDAPAAGPLFRIADGPSPTREFVTPGPDGVPELHPSARQRRALESDALRLLVCAGWQAGKTCVGPWVLARWMQELGPGNYLLAAPSFRLLSKQAVPELHRCLGRLLGLGEVVGGAYGEFRISAAGHRRLWGEGPWAHTRHDPLDPSRIVFGHADQPDSLASITAKAAWLDECGQRRFKKESHEEIRARLATTGGPMLYTTRPYYLGWLKEDVYDRADRNRRAAVAGKPPDPTDAGHEVVEFESIDNPRFSRQEWDQARATMPAWAFDLKYRGKWTRPAGAVYDCFDPNEHLIDDFDIPPDWRRFVGFDFGGVNTAAVFFAEAPEELPGPTRPGQGPLMNGQPPLVIYAYYHGGTTRTAREHVVEVLKKTAGKPPALAVGGSGSEDQWRAEFRQAGYVIAKPLVREVHNGITRVYATIRTGGLRVFRSCKAVADQLANYSYEVDEAGQATEAIEDKAAQHYCDCVRYLISQVRNDRGAWEARVVGDLNPAGRVPGGRLGMNRGY